MIIRKFQPKDAASLVKILELNDQYGIPEVDRQGAMIRVHECAAAVFLVCEIEGIVVGLIRGIYDGSRAMIHQLSVHPSYQRQGIGSTLVLEIIKNFYRSGAPTVSATITEKSSPFWYHMGFKKTKTFLVGNWWYQSLS